MSVKRLFVPMLIFGMLTLLSCTVKDGNMIRVLLTTGGHDFEEGPFFEMFNGLPGISYDRIMLPDSAHLLKPGLEEKYDVIVRYDMVDSVNREAEQSFTDLLNRGMGLVALHHNLAAHRNWKEYTRIIGGKYLFEPVDISGQIIGPSGYQHDVDIPVKVADPAHPILKDVTDFRIHDEIYKNYYVSPGAEVLLTTEHPESNPELAWTTRYGNSKVVYILLGHDSQAWNNPVYPKLLTNAIRWAAE